MYRLDDHQFVVTNTCAFDSVAQLLICSSFWNDEIKQIISNNSGRNALFQFVNKITDYGLIDSRTYLERFQLLRLSRSVRHQISYNRLEKKFCHNFWSNCSGNLSHLMKGYPSYSDELALCNCCGLPAETRTGNSLLIKFASLENGDFANFIIRNYLSETTFCVDGFCPGRRTHTLYTGN